MSTGARLGDTPSPHSGLLSPGNRRFPLLYRCNNLRSFSPEQHLFVELRHSASAYCV